MNEYLQPDLVRRVHEERDARPRHRPPRPADRRWARLRPRRNRVV